MRLFVAVPLPPDLLPGAARVLDGLRERGWPVRWVRPDSLHVTLKFFGEVLPDREGIITEMLGFAVQGTPPIRLALSGAGAFPDLQRPRVLRLDVGVGSEALELLQDRIERGGLRIGFPPEGRPFHPHVTLGRVKEGQRLPAAAAQTLQRIGAGPVAEASQVVLFESLQTRTGPAYLSRAEFPLLA